MRGSMAFTVYDAVAIFFSIAMIAVLFVSIYLVSSNTVFANIDVSHTGNLTRITLTLHSTSKTFKLYGVTVYALDNSNMIKYAYGNIDGKCESTRGIKIVDVSLDKLCSGVEYTSGSSITIVLDRNVLVDHVSIYLKIEDKWSKVDVYR